MIQLTAWTDEKPTKPGLYWYRIAAQEIGVNGCLLDVRNMGTTGTLIARMQWFNMPSTHCPVTSLHGQWAAYEGHSIANDELHDMWQALANLTESHRANLPNLKMTQANYQQQQFHQREYDKLVRVRDMIYEVLKYVD